MSAGGEGIGVKAITENGGEAAASLDESDLPY